MWWKSRCHWSGMLRLAVGDAIAVRIWDAITGELLAEQPATVYVELDW